MENLIKVLREQHWQISSLCDILENLSKLDLSKETDIEDWMIKKDNLVSHLKKFKIILVGHLKVEDKYLYPALLSSKNKKIKETAKKFSDEMQQISEKVFSFFEKYAHLKVDDLSNSDFMDDMHLIISIIRKRIGIEETDLYPLYNKLNPN